MTILNPSFQGLVMIFFSRHREYTDLMTIFFFFETEGVHPSGPRAGFCSSTKTNKQKTTTKAKLSIRDKNLAAR
jgi:hypothetical protein